ncbi:MAG: hypothetical protein M0R77_16855 [Gammaproteobacteria bacterium]|nr:hypothetical protein [Gammaproteobacteria bacterium]
MATYQSKPNLTKVVKSTVDLLTIIEAVGLDENSTFFEHELRFGILADQDQYDKIPEHLKKHFKKVAD